MEDKERSSKGMESEVPGLEGDQGTPRGMDGQLEKLGIKLDSPTYTEIVTNGIKKLKCSSCDKVCDNSKQMKTHIKKTHTKKDKNVTKKTSENKATTEEMNKKIFEQYGTCVTTNISSIEEILNYGKEHEVANEIEKGKEAAVMEVDESLEEENKWLKTEIQDMKTQIKELETELQAKSELFLAKTERCDALEEEKMMTKKNLDSLHVIAGRMFNDLNAIKEVGGNAATLEINRKLRKANMQLKETGHNLSESIRLCGEEANQRAKAEAELARNSNSVNILSRTVNMMSN